MLSIREMQMFEPKKNSLVIPTYDLRRDAGIDMSYQERLEMTVNARVQNQQKQAELVSHMKKLGYDSCDVDPRDDTIRISSISGLLNRTAILKFIKKNIDKNASVQRTMG